LLHFMIYSMHCFMLAATPSLSVCLSVLSRVMTCSVFKLTDSQMRLC
jgi:hypothetical protein